MIRRALTPVVALALPLACAEGPTVPASIGTLSVDPVHQWAGGSVWLHAEGLGAIDDLRVHIDDAESTTSRVAGADSFALQIPPDADGRVEIVVSDGNRTLGSVRVEAYGFDEIRVFGVELDRYATRWPIEFGTAVIGGYRLPGIQNGGIAVLSLSTGATKRYDGIHNPSCRSPIVSDQSTSVFVCPPPDLGPAEQYELGPEARSLGSLPFGLGTFHNAELSPGIVLEGWHHDVNTIEVEGATARLVTSLRTEEIHGVEVLAGHDRAMLETNWVSVPVLEASSGELVYELEFDGRNSRSVASSEGRGLFYVLSFFGREAGYTQMRLVRVNAASGSIVDSASYAPADQQSEYDEVAYDPVRDLLVLSVPTAERLFIIDAGDLRRVGEVDLAGRYPPQWWDSKIFLDEDSGRGFIVFSLTATGQTPVLTFRLPPPTG